MNYKMKETLGLGSFAKVVRGVPLDENREEVTDEEVAIKIYEKRKLCPVNRDTVKREIQSLRKVRHKNLVSLLQTVSTTTHVYLVMTFGGGCSLEKRLASWTD